MNAVMAGMIPTMIILMTRDMSSMSPMSLRYWAIMSLATLIGLATAYPVNGWLVAHGLKHGMGTVRALGTGGHSLATENQMVLASHGEKNTAATPAASTHGPMTSIEGM